MVIEAPNAFTNPLYRTVKTYVITVSILGWWLWSVNAEDFVQAVCRKNERWGCPFGGLSVSKSRVYTMGAVPVKFCYFLFK